MTEHLSASSAVDYDPFDCSPLYLAADGRTGPDPLTLAGSPPRFSLAKLALYLSSPAIAGEFQPDCPWSGVSRRRASVPWPTDENQVSRVEDIVDHFQQSIAACIGSAPVVAVTYSGGLDSLAVLFHTQQVCQAQGRRLIAVTADLVDDSGVSSASVACQLIGRLQVSCDVLVVETGSAGQFPEPAWNRHGPRNDAMPRINRAVAEAAVRAGASVLLSGSGADELLGANRYLSPRLFQKGWRAVATYLHDIAQGGNWRRVLLEGLSIGARMARRYSTQVYWATNWPELCLCQPPLILGHAFRSQVEQWTADWVDQVLAFHDAHHGGDWAFIDAWDAVYPADVVTGAGVIEERAPFWEPAFVRYAMAIPLCERYAAQLHTPYHRRKAAILRLYPHQAHAFLPAQKQHFSRSFQSYHQSRPLRARRCVALGLTQEALLDRCDATLLNRVDAIERWIVGAEERGAIADW